MSTAFQRKVLAPVLPEAPLALRLFVGPVKTDSQRHIITGESNDPVKNLVGAEPVGLRAGVDRYAKITFAVDYLDGRPDLGQRFNQTLRP